MNLASKNVFNREVEVNEDVDSSTTNLHVGKFSVVDPRNIVHQDTQNMISNISIKSYGTKDTKVNTYLLYVCR